MGLEWLDKVTGAVVTRLDKMGGATVAGQGDWGCGVVILHDVIFPQTSCK